MKTYKDIIALLIDTTEKLSKDEISIELSRQICNNCQTLINAAKLHLEVCKYQKEIDKEFFYAPKENLILNVNSSIPCCENCIFGQECKVKARCGVEGYKHFKSKIDDLKDLKK